MGRAKKDARYLNVYIRRDIYEEFDRLCEVLGQSKTVATERALRQYMNSMEKSIAADINPMIFEMGNLEIVKDGV